MTNEMSKSQQKRIAIQSEQELPPSKKLVAVDGELKPSDIDAPRLVLIRKLNSRGEPVGDFAYVAYWATDGNPAKQDQHAELIAAAVNGWQPLHDEIERLRALHDAYVMAAAKHAQELERQRDDARIVSDRWAVEAQRLRASNEPEPDESDEDTCRLAFQAWANDLGLRLDEIFMSTAGVPEHPYEDNDTNQFWRAWLASWKAKRASKPPVPEWQPIETAPYRTEVLVYLPDDGAKLTAYSDGIGWRHVETAKRLLEQPTHWHPLPDGPALTKAGEQA